MTTEQTAALLNDLLAVDDKAIRQIFESIVLCNPALADVLGIAPPEGRPPEVRVIDIINATISPLTGRVDPIIDIEHYGRITGFTAVEFKKEGTA